MVSVNSLHGLPMWHFNGIVIIGGNAKVKFIEGSWKMF
jgi:hypothetical protein